MKRLLFALLLLIASSVDAGTITARCNLSILPDTKRLFSRPDVTYVTIFGNPAEEPFVLEHYITNTTAYVSGNRTTPYSVGLTSIETAIAGQCYKAIISSRADDSDSSAMSLRICAPTAAPAPSPTPTPCTSTDPTLCDITGGGSTTGGTQTKSSDQCYYDLVYGSVCNSPIVVNLGYGGYRFSDTSVPVSFDLDADGQTDRVTWTDVMSDIAFLALDRNHNGMIDSGAELFGNHTPQPDGTTTENGFEALARLDTNHDGKIDANDSVWLQLRFWTDHNHNGTTEPEELTEVDGSGVTALNYTYHWTGRRDSNGNMLRYEARYTIDGTQRPYYDVYLRMLR